MKTEQKKGAIQKMLVVILVVGLAIAISLVADSSASKSTVTALSSRIDSLSTDMEAYYVSVNLKVAGVEAQNDTLRALAERNARCVQKLYDEVVALSARVTETRKLAETHGKKINDLSETVFKAAYGSAWADSGKAVWDKYVLCGNQEYWNEVVKRLTPEQMQKILQVDQLNQRISALENSLTTP